MSNPLDVLRHHVTGAIERGEKAPIVEQSVSNEYLDALAAARLASQAYRLASEAFRSCLIDDAAFIAARKAFDESTKVLDAAFSKEQTR